jgi:hypothetical protein
VASTVGQAFREFGRNLEITGLQASTVSTRQQHVREAVEAELTVLDSFLTGSYRRHTMIAPLKEADVDVFVVLDAKYFEHGGQAALLDKVRRALLKTYTKSPRISRNGQAVTITFSDFVVDVVPGFYRDGGGFLIPDSVQSRWIATDPKKHVDIWAEANKAHAGDLIPLMKMLKAWNRAHSAVLRSFHLEVLTLQSLEGVTIPSFSAGARYVFDKARDRVCTPSPDPARFTGSVGGYLDTSTKVQAAVERLDAACTKAREAEAYESQGYHRSAIEKWQVVFGDYFPAYG